MTLHNVVTCTENAVEHKEIALGAFTGTEGTQTSMKIATIW
jgi:hypothetical protein